jgi:hypothetical protein
MALGSGLAVPLSAGVADGHGGRDGVIEPEAIGLETDPPPGVIVTDPDVRMTGNVAWVAASAIVALRSRSSDLPPGPETAANLRVTNVVSPADTDFPVASTVIVTVPFWFAPAIASAAVAASLPKAKTDPVHAGRP